MSGAQTRATHLAIALLIVAVVAVVHHDIYTVPFNYSEVSGIQRNRVVINVDTFAERMLTPKGILQRPLSVASYMLNYAVHGDRVAGFHLVNFVIHGANTIFGIFPRPRVLLGAAHGGSSLRGFIHSPPRA